MEAAEIQTSSLGQTKRLFGCFYCSFSENFNLEEKPKTAEQEQNKCFSKCA